MIVVFFSKKRRKESTELMVSLKMAQGNLGKAKDTSLAILFEGENINFESVSGGSPSMSEVSGELTANSNNNKEKNNNNSSVYHKNKTKPSVTFVYHTVLISLTAS